MITYIYGYPVYICNILEKDVISQDVQNYLQTISDDTDHVQNRNTELQKIKQLSAPGLPLTYPDSTVDVYITTPAGKEILIDVTTVKPNKKSFVS